MSTNHSLGAVGVPGIAFGILVVLLVLGARWLRTRPYRTVFRIAARRDDASVCRGEHERAAVTVEPDGLALPAGLRARGQTAFLELRVEATPAGAFWDPFIEVRSGALSYRQYFERGVAGRRHLNLSPVFQGGAGEAPGRVALAARGLRWQREATLATFAPPPVDGAEVVVLAPHPDDAEIAAFGMYARDAAPSWVATITGGDHGMANLAPVVPHAEGSRWSADLRVWDSLTIPQLGGVPRERCVNLVHPDGCLRRMYEQPAAPLSIACEPALARSALRARNAAAEFQGGDAGCTWGGLVEDLRRLLEKADPDVVVCPHPLIDGHHDHVFTTVALEQAVRQLPPRPRFFFLYVVHRRDVPLYPFGSADTVVSLPPWTDEEWLADSVYSHPLPPDVQRAKYFAIEATHDLRVYQAGAPRTLRQALRATRAEIAALAGGTSLPAGSFLRRAARPNEIYWVVSETSLSDLVARAVARAGAAQ